MSAYAAIKDVFQDVLPNNYHPGMNQIVQVAIERAGDI